MRGVWITLLFVSFLILAAFMVTLFSICMHRRQIFRRLAQAYTRCPFGCGPDYQVVRKIPSTKAPENPDLLFSIALFGKPNDVTFKKRYFNGFVSLMQKKEKLWPNARMRVYVSESVCKAVEEKFTELGAELYVVSPEPIGFEAMMWRFWACDDSDIPVISMDADMEDSIVNEEYAKMIRAWMLSDKPFLVKRHFWFKTGLPMTGGRWGAKPNAFRNLFGQDFTMQKLAQTVCDTTFGTDEAFLNREIWPHISDCSYFGPMNKEEYAWIGIFAGLGLALTLVAYLSICGTA